MDQNLSWRLVKALQPTFPESVHVLELGLDRAADADVWEYARTEGFVIVSKDSDFEQRSILHGHPPKCIWLRVGNCCTREIELLCVPSAPGRGSERCFVRVSRLK
ncbi:MAG: DUF5615 family PIN-like protein, partial [Limisphaerales bacterium]